MQDKPERLYRFLSCGPSAIGGSQSYLALGTCQRGRSNGKSFPAIQGPVQRNNSSKALKSCSSSSSCEGRRSPSNSRWRQQVVGFEFPGALVKSNPMSFKGEALAWRGSGPDREILPGWNNPSSRAHGYRSLVPAGRKHQVTRPARPAGVGPRDCADCRPRYPAPTTPGAERIGVLSARQDGRPQAAARATPGVRAYVPSAEPVRSSLRRHHQTALGARFSATQNSRQP